MSNAIRLGSWICRGFEAIGRAAERQIKRVAEFVCHSAFVPLCCSIMHESAVSNSDATTTIAELRQLIADFVAERDWSQFHSPKNVSMALAIEAAELMEHFQWLTTDASRRLVDDPQKLAEIGEELADVIGYSFALANELGIDVSAAIRAKMIKNARKYPTDEFRGRYSREDHGKFDQ
jgi:NTP pyrophosphatase (non-canonical NTP hydrolase)